MMMGFMQARRRDVDNDNLAVGYVTKNVSGLTKTKFFVPILTPRFKDGPRWLF